MLFWSDENGLERDRDGGGITSVNVLNATGLNCSL